MLHDIYSHKSIISNLFAKIKILNLQKIVMSCSDGGNFWWQKLSDYWGLHSLLLRKFALANLVLRKRLFALMNFAHFYRLFFNLLISFVTKCKQIK